MVTVFPSGLNIYGTIKKKKKNVIQNSPFSENEPFFLVKICPFIQNVCSFLNLYNFQHHCYCKHCYSFQLLRNEGFTLLHPSHPPLLSWKLNTSDNSSKKHHGWVLLKESFRSSQEQIQIWESSRRELDPNAMKGTH